MIATRGGVVVPCANSPLRILNILFMEIPILPLTLAGMCTLYMNEVSAGGTWEKPNIIQIIVDDLGYADLGFLPYAAGDVSTPGIDRLRQSGIFCSESYVTAPISSPSRTGMITGRYQQRWGNYWFGEGGLPAEELTLPQILRDNGYFTAKIGKTHHNGGTAEHPLNHGFDYFMGFVSHSHDYARLSDKDVEEYGYQNAKKADIGPLERNGEKISFENAYTTDVFTDEAIHLIRRENGKPLYLQLDYNAVHHPIYVNNPKYLEHYGIKQFPYWNPNECTFEEWHSKWAKLGEVDPDGRKRYLATLACLDDNINRLLDVLEEEGLLNNTIIVFISDNGGAINTYANNGPLRSFKKTLFEGGIKVPLIISYPKHIKARSTFNKMVSSLDVMPTLLDYANIAIPENLDGISLVSRLEGENTADSHQALFFDDGINYAVRKGKWKLLVMNKLRPAFTKGKCYFDYYAIVNGKAVKSAPYYNPLGMQLYNIESDKSEKYNLLDSYPEIVEELDSLYKNWRSRMRNPMKPQ